VYLASLRDQNTGRYEHHGMSQVFGDDEADQSLRESHGRTFADWLCFGLELQKADLDLYLSSFEPDKRTILETWIRLAPYRNLVPASAREVERRLYLTDLEALLDLLKNGTRRFHPDACYASLSDYLDFIRGVHRAKSKPGGAALRVGYR
jgi:hypothetical protein